MLAPIAASVAADAATEDDMELSRQPDCDRAVAALAARIASDADDATIAAAADETLPLARALAEAHRRHRAALSPELARWLEDRGEPAVADFATAPAMVSGAASEDDVVACWRTQLRGCGEALAGLLAGDPEIGGLWLYWDDQRGARAPAEPFFRAEQVRNVLFEVRKLARALAGPRALVRVAAGRTILDDETSSEPAQWDVEGTARITPCDHGLRIAGDGCSLWCRPEFGDAIIAFDYRPIGGAGGGGGGGALFAFPGRPMPGETLNASSGPMERYNRGIDTYHASLYRGGGPMSNLRRAGRGLRMLSSVRPDPCGRLGVTYHVELLKLGPSLQVYVDGVLVHAYLDAGVQGPVIARGRFGMRLFSGETLEVELRHVTIRELLPAH